MSRKIGHTKPGLSTSSARAGGLRLSIATAITMEKRKRDQTRRSFLQVSCGLLTVAGAEACAPQTPPTWPKQPMKPPSEQIYDALIVGGGPAGLSAALYLGRSRKRVIVLDRGNPRHAVAAGVHNFLTRDGVPPSQLRDLAWKQMAPYSTVSRQAAVVQSLERKNEQWRATLDDGRVVAARAALLATGVVDEHPDIPGYAERWGHSIHHCPFCHGWEMRDRALALLGAGDAVAHLAPLLKGWSNDILVLTHGEDLPAPIHDMLGSLNIPVFKPRVVRLEGRGRALSEIVLADRRSLRREGLFVAGRQRQCDVVADLNLELDDGGYVVVDEMGATARPMLWAAGDLTTRSQQVVEAAAQGGRAGAAIASTLTRISNAIALSG